MHLYRWWPLLAVVAAYVCLPFQARAQISPAAVAPEEEESSPPGATTESRSTSAPSLTLAVGASAGIAPDLLAAAVSRELNVDVLVQPGPSSLTVTGDGSSVIRVAFQDASGHRVERVLTRPSNEAIAIEMVALLAGNLVRNEASDLILRLRAAREARLATEPPPVLVPLSKQAPPVRLEGACARAKKSLYRVPAGADLFPFVGSSSSTEGRNATRAVSFGFFGALGGGVHGVALSGLLDVESDFVCGAQIAGAVNVVGGPASGTQIAGIVNIAQAMNGGALAGGVNIVRGHANGATVAGAANVSGGDVHGVQVAGGVNVAREVDGAQIGAVNVAKRVRGVQLGMINVARDADVPIGLLNIVTRGETHVDVWQDSGGLSTAGLVHGSRYVHNIYAAGARLYGEKPAGFVALGLGARVFDRSRVAIDVDGITHWLANDRNSLRLIHQLRVLATLRVAPPLSLLAGVTANAETTDDPDETPDLPLSHGFGKSDGTRAILWPGITVGARLF